MPREYRRRPLADRFWAKVRKTDGCWEWTGARTSDGYGAIGAGGREGAMLVAHRLSYEMHVGQIATGLLVCHTCDNPGCVNPAHLFLGDERVNARDMVTKGRQGGQFPTGVAHPMAKLTPAAVSVIKVRLAAGDAPARIADDYSVARHTIRAIHRGDTWRHVTPSSP